MAALFNSLKITGKPIENLRVLVLGTGAAGIACTKMMQESGISQIIGCDRQGRDLHRPGRLRRRLDVRHQEVVRGEHQ